MLRISGLSKRFQGHDVLRDVSLILRPGEVTGLIGRSGAGKSTLARCMVGLEQPECGQISLNGVAIAPGQADARRHIQYLWQDPSQSLSPYLTAHSAVLEVLNGFRIGTDRPAKARELLNDLGITPDMQSRRPHSLSGGQCQRVALARALAADPQVLILDEPLSALDLPTQLHTIALLHAMHQRRGLALLVVSHDLAPLRQLADRILVLDTGRIVEDIPMAGFTETATHPLAQAYAATLGVSE